MKTFLKVIECHLVIFYLLAKFIILFTNPLSLCLYLSIPFCYFLFSGRNLILESTVHFKGQYNQKKFGVQDFFF